METSLLISPSDERVLYYKLRRLLKSRAPNDESFVEPPISLSSPLI